MASNILSLVCNKDRPSLYRESLHLSIKLRLNGCSIRPSRVPPCWFLVWLLNYIIKVDFDSQILLKSKIHLNIAVHFPPSKGQYDMEWIPPTSGRITPTSGSSDWPKWDPHMAFTCLMGPVCMGICQTVQHATMKPPGEPWITLHPNPLWMSELPRTDGSFPGDYWILNVNPTDFMYSILP